ncbi:kinectin-like isoform X4 [Polyodon spathula]|uniref:kinectin-like isoform X4 n=1 Tax=Polyodon spathula TaxID=7913 RepID=UPI001B7E48A6|nr:kinectin-like isoform X4 [Polyodon spathula]
MRELSRNSGRDTGRERLAGIAVILTIKAAGTRRSNSTVTLSQIMMELYDSQYLLILAPSLVIAIMFLFFWLFMKETSYDEVLARQKRDHKPLPVRPESRKKNEKKKSKKKESGGGVLGDVANGQESDSEHRDFDLTEAVPEEEDQTSSIVITPASNEAPAGLRDRKRRDRKQQQQQQQQQSRAGQDESAREVNGSKPAPKKETMPLTKQPTPPTDAASGKKKSMQKKQKIEADDFHTETKPESVCVPTRKEVPLLSLDAKLLESSTGKKKSASKKQKPEPGLGDEPLNLAPVYIPPMYSDPATAVPEKKSMDTATKTNAKKLKNETDKENSEVKFKEYLSILKSLTQEETINVAAVLIERNPAVLDSWQRQSGKADITLQQLQERERLLSTFQEEASIAKEKVKQLSQELLVEKQKGSLAESLLREQRGAMEKELSVLQGKAQGNYQENQAVQIKFQQLEGQIARLQQENGILRDAVSSATTQMESKQSSELTKLRGDYGRVMAELAEKSSKLQQEDALRKNVEVTYKQTVSQLEGQLQQAERRWEDLQGFLRSLTAEHEKLQASNQELQNKLLAVESELGSKNKEVQTLHSSLTDTMVSKEQVEQKMMQLLEASQHSRVEDTVQDLLNKNTSLTGHIETLQAQVESQTSMASLVEELQKRLAEKEAQRNALEDCLKVERSSWASREAQLQAVHNESMTLKAEVQKLQAQNSEQQAASQLILEQMHKSAQEKEEKIVTVENLLEAGLIEVANKEDQLKGLRVENEALRLEVCRLQLQNAEQTSSEATVEELQREILEKDGRLKFVEDMLQAELEKVSGKEKLIQALELQSESLKEEVQAARHREAEQVSIRSQFQELQILLQAKGEQVQVLEHAAEERGREAVEREQQLQVLREESSSLRVQLLEEQQRVQEQQNQVQMAPPSQELLSSLMEKEKQVAELQSELGALREAVELHRKKNNELREKNWSAMEALSATESVLQGKLDKTAKEGQKALASVEMQTREALHRLFPSLPLPRKQNHQEWLLEFETAAKEALASKPEDSKLFEEKLRESEELHRIMQKDCETYKKVLAETEGILQRLQSSVEQEESRWRVKLEVSQSEQRQLRQERQNLEFQLVKAEEENATYVSEVRELKDLLTELQSKLDGSYSEAVRQNEELNLLKTQLKETLSKLEAEERERHKVAGDLHKAQQGLDLIQTEILKETGQASLIENSTLATEMEETDRKNRMAGGLNQTVRELQQLLQSVSQQLSKGHEGNDDKPNTAEI